MPTTLGWRRRATTVSHSVPSRRRVISSGKGRRTSIARRFSGHKAGVAGIYNRAERKAALELRAAHVAALATGRSAKVIAFKGAR